MEKRFAGVLLAVVLLAVSPTYARAATILPNCGTCGDHNTAWDLTLALIDDTNNIYQLTALATYGSPVDFGFVNAVAFKVDAFVNNFEAGPTVTGPPEDTWNLLENGISAAGCGGSGNGFWCANSAGSGAAPGGSGSTDTWVFLINVNNSLPNVAGVVAGSFKAQFVSNLASKVDSLLSEDVSFTLDSPLPLPEAHAPEPATLIMFGTGLAVIATAMRRRRKGP
jgi:hypothetical protein